MSYSNDIIYLDPRQNYLRPPDYNDSNRPLMQADEPSQSAVWNGISEKIKQRTVGDKVRHFVENMKTLPVKKTVPNDVRLLLEQQYDPWAKWKKRLGNGWNPYRLDVMIVEFIVLVFHAAAMWLYTCHMVLYRVDVGCFPGIYFGIIALGIFYKLNTKVLLYDRVIVDRFSIFINYMTHHFLIDFWMVYLSIMEYASVNTGFFRMISFVILYEARIVFGKIGVCLDSFKYVKVIYKLIIILIVNLFLCHVVALILIVMVTKDKHPNWMDGLNLTRDQDRWINTYIYAFYWAMTIMMTVGFGDITPKRIKQVIIVTFIELFSIVLLAYWLNKIQSLLIELRESQTAKVTNLRTINRLMENNRVPYNIQKIVKKDVHDMSNSINVRQVEQENNLLASLSPYVKDRLLETIHCGPLMQMSLWNRMTTDTIKKIAVNLQRKLYYNDEVLIGQSDVPSKMMMLRDGRIKFQYQNRKVTHVTTGEVIQVQTRKMKSISWLADKLEYYEALKPRSYTWLGLDHTLKQIPAQWCVRSQGLSLVIFIDTDKAMQLIKQTDRDYQAFCMYRQQMTFSNLHSQVRCPLCVYANHTACNCPFYHYIPPETLVAAKHLQKTRNKRTKLDPNPRVRRAKRRNRYPWIRPSMEDETVIVGGLKQAKMASLQEMRDRKARGQRVPVREETMERLEEYDRPPLQRFLSTLPDFETAYNWEAYYVKKNVLPA